METRDWRTCAERNEGLLGLDGERCVARCIREEGVLPSGKHDVLVVRAEGLVKSQLYAHVNKRKHRRVTIDLIVILITSWILL